MQFKHIPIMLAQCIEYLDIKPNGIFVDCTAGGGGHSEEILRHLTDGRLVAIDKDIDAINACKQRFENFPSKKISYVQNDYKHFVEILDELNIDKVDGVLIDLGISSYQIDNIERGFSYMGGDAPLDMRMNQSQKLTAEEIVNTYSTKEIFCILRDYGEEKFAQNIAKNITLERQQNKITTCKQLADIVDKSIPYAMKRTGGHPAKRTFQALRIEVNAELLGLDTAIKQMISRLNVGGRMVVLTFHSLEDRIVKKVFADSAIDCICPPSLPMCVCNHRAVAKILTKKPITATEIELQQNPRSASCKLRAIEKI